MTAIQRRAYDHRLRRVKVGDRSILGSALSNDTKFHYGDFVRVDITTLTPWSRVLCVEPPVLARLRAALADHPPK